MVETPKALECFLPRPVTIRPLFHIRRVPEEVFTLMTATERARSDASQLDQDQAHWVVDERS